MKILLLSTSLGIGGADQQVLYLARGLVDGGHEVFMISMVPLSTMGLEAQKQGFLVSSLMMRRGIPSPLAILALSRIIRDWKPQIVHSHMVHANLLARITRLVAPFPRLIATSHNVNEGAYWRRVAYRITDPLCDLTTSVSQVALKRSVQTFSVPKNKIICVPNCVDLDKFKPDFFTKTQVREDLKLNDKFVWLAVGRFEKQKDYPNLLKAFSDLVEHFPSSILLICGDGSLKAEVQELITKLNLSESVLLLGIRRDIPQLMCAADAYLMSSAWEGMPVVLLEASASGLPIVATNVGGNCEVVIDGETGFLVPPSNSSALAQAMEKLMSMPHESLAKLGESGRELALKLSGFDQSIQRWEELYKSLLANNSLRKI